jgi:hypothetical protein
METMARWRSIVFTCLEEAEPMLRRSALSRCRRAA